MPSEKQREFLESKSDEVLYGGSAGPGKSDAILAFCIGRRVMHPGSVGLVLRRSLPELERGSGLIPRAKELLYGFGEWQERKHSFRFSNGSVQEFGYCEGEDDIYRYYGAEYADIAFDEAGQFTERQFKGLKSRCRVTRESGISPLIRLASNPGSAWLKRLFIDPTGDKTGQSGGCWDVDMGDHGCLRREFIPARLDDNPHINAGAYRRTLADMPESLRVALLDGRWDVFEGQYFKEFDVDKHVVEREVDAYSPRIVGIDYGYAAPFCALWGAMDDKRRIHIYREVYRSGLRAEEQAGLVLSYSRREPIQIYKADPSIWAKHGDLGRSIEEAYAERGLFVYRGSNDRLGGWNRIRSMLCTVHPDGIPALTIHPRCDNLIRELQEARHDTNRPEDLNTKDSDHAIDAARYMLADYRGWDYRDTRGVPDINNPLDFERIVGYFSGLKASERSGTQMIRETDVRWH